MKTPVKIKKLLPGKKVGLSGADLANDTIVIEVDWRNKAGKLIYPYLYKIDTKVVTKYLDGCRHGFMYYAVPLGLFKKIAKRAELDLANPQTSEPGDCITATDPRIRSWTEYL